MLKVFILCLLSLKLLIASPLQDAINKAKPYSILKLSNYTYKGAIIINKPLSIIGAKKTIIDGLNKNNTITITSDNVVLKNLTIINSGKNLEQTNSAIFIQNTKNSQIINCTIKEVLYGIYLENSHNNIIKNNYISSYKTTISQKGGGLKLWHSNNNKITNNKIEFVKNNVINFSSNNIFKNNQFLHSMYGLHFEQTKNQIIKNNIFQYNASAIVSMGNKNLKIINNKILSCTGQAGIGIVLGGGKNIHIVKNKISFNSKAIYIDSKLNESQMTRYITNNEISYNLEAIHFHKTIRFNTITNNNIFANIEDIIVDIRGIKNAFFTNKIEYNYWGSYVGFDKNQDGIGDTSFKILQYSDRLYQYNPKVKFFYATPIMSIIDFFLKIIPFIEPNFLFEDKKPIFQPHKL